MMNLSRRGLMIGTAALIASSAVRAANHDILTIEGPAFGARWRVSASTNARSADIVAAVMEVVSSVDNAMSPFRPGSEISRFNAALTTEWQAMSQDTMQVLQEAQRVSRLSGGAFDPTLGGIAGRYGFGPILEEPAGAFVDMGFGPDQARKADPRQTLDLCGIAKGHALDRVVAALSALGIQDALVEMGGEVLALGGHPDGRAWNVGVEHPLGDDGSLWHRIALAGEALATSGDRHNSYRAGARRYGHIVNPRRMMPADTPLASVTVFAPRAMTADALATALFALGAEVGPGLAQREGIPALFLIRDGTGLREVMTAEYASRMVT